MSFPRIILGITGLSALFSFLASPTDCGQKTATEYFQLRVTCTTTITVMATGVDEPDAYVCKNNNVKWDANGHDFVVFFKHDCPFPSCKKIDNQHPTAGPMKDLQKLTVFDYGIIIDGTLYDPHIIGGG
jgi:hypothetical protein